MHGIDFTAVTLLRSLFNSNFNIMLAKGLAATAAELVGTRIVESGANKAIQSLPQQKQNRIKGVLMVVAGIMLFKSGLKLLKRERNVNSGS
ncbi:MAG TPA: hypothetical protein VF008_12910 [Niastella sp.]